MRTNILDLIALFNRLCPSDRVLDDAENVRIVVRTAGLVTGLEVEYLARTSMEASSRSGSAVSFSAIRAVCANACTAIPDRTMVLFFAFRSRNDSAIAAATAASAPTNADTVTAAVPDRNRIPAAAPVLAPEETPTISGDASGFPKTV